MNANTTVCIDEIVSIYMFFYIYASSREHRKCTNTDDNLLVATINEGTHFLYIFFISLRCGVSGSTMRM